MTVTLFLFISYFSQSRCTDDFSGCGSLQQMETDTAVFVIRTNAVTILIDSGILLTTELDQEKWLIRGRKLQSCLSSLPTVAHPQARSTTFVAYTFRMGGGDLECCHKCIGIGAAGSSMNDDNYCDSQKSLLGDTNSFQPNGRFRARSLHFP